MKRKSGYYASIFSLLCLSTLVEGEIYRSFLLSPMPGGLYEAQEIPIPFPGDHVSVPVSINNLGQVVGRTAESDFGYGRPEESHMYLFQNGVSQYIGNGFPVSINEHSQIVGQEWPNNFIYENGQKTYLDLGYEKLFVNGINNNGTIIGYSSGQGLLSKRCFYYKDGTRTDFNIDKWGFPSSINDNEIIVGESDNEAFIYQNGNLNLIPTNDGSARDINDNNQVVGWTNVNGQIFPFLWENDAIIILGTLGGAGAALSLNNNGDVVGTCKVNSGEIHAFLFKDEIFYDLNDLISNKQEMISMYGQWTLTWAYDINDEGYIIAEGDIPEPASLLLSVLGAMMILRKRK